MELDDDTCFRALAARDRRFDGRFFVAVRTTGIYCRPICPARTPRRDRVAFFARAAEAEREGYRACFRCRPELAPGAGPVDAVPRLVAAAAARIEAGFLNEGSVEELSAALGVTPRHLRRTVQAELGASPVELAQSRRLALAKQLLHDTALPMAEVALAAGFGSLRRFNAIFRDRFGRPPSSIRRDHGQGAAGAPLVLRLEHRPPFDWETQLGFLAGRCTAGVEQVEDGTYRRTVHLGAHQGWVAVTADPARPALRVEVAPSLIGALMPLVARLRALFDLDARPDAIAARLGDDPLLARSLRRHPGLRVAGAFDGFEAAARVVLGQQVSVSAATTVAGRLAAALGGPVATPFPGLDRLSASAEQVAAAGEDRIARLGMPGARARTLLGIARACAEGRLQLHRGGDVEATRAVLRGVPGVGPWTAELVAMRALGAPDAFPGGDLGVLRALGVASARAAEARAERWRPWRAYAVMHLWSGAAKGGGDGGA
ncbi:DNA-3-methyladenine glycosylase 2 [Anaeromyxobacter diazotrophicus]|uniref:DNA-3-methyladenine glycosylase II n=1 Tax=Anaeromyxobacter diazotrophicus TaxID=2590199 RepID=A0A7I9VJC8_9BACT|nr:DNA-3-methyladenine glycosylase 2 [Anaeromyxobacter diazotrophicus]GEJ56289.1 AraC family transcriptional regulator [Anaeromyxobacter diazotrophicus]